MEIENKTHNRIELKYFILSSIKTIPAKTCYGETYKYSYALFATKKLEDINTNSCGYAYASKNNGYITNVDPLYPYFCAAGVVIKDAKANRDVIEVNLDDPVVTAIIKHTHTY